jgi:hypothetical protein
MKTFKYQLVLFLMFAGLLGFNFQASSQDFSNNQKLTRKEKKEADRAYQIANFKAIDTLLQNKTYVLEAEYLQNRLGDQIPVARNINFVRVNSDQVILQTGNNFDPGYNGVGGVTAEGTLNNYKVTSDEKKLNHTVFFSTTTQIGTYDIILRIDSDAHATATITGFSRGSLTYRGNLVALYNSRVFKGRNSL